MHLDTLIRSRCEMCNCEISYHRKHPFFVRKFCENCRKGVFLQNPFHLTRTERRELMRNTAKPLARQCAEITEIVETEINTTKKLNWDRINIILRKKYPKQSIDFFKQKFTAVEKQTRGTLEKVKAETKGKKIISITHKKASA